MADKIVEPKIDLTNLEEKLNTLKGYDFELAENLERKLGNVTYDITFSKGFQIRLAGMALGIPAEDLKDLPMKDYQQICQRVLNFLFADLEKTPTL